MSSAVETSLYCHSERSEESVTSVTIAVYYLLFHFPCSDRAFFDSFSTGRNSQNCVWRSFDFAQDDRGTIQDECGMVQYEGGVECLI